MHDLAVLKHLIRHRLPDTSPVGLLKTFPGSILLFSVVVSCGLSTRHLSVEQYRPILNRFGLDYDITQKSHVLHIFTPLFIQPSPGIGWKMVCMIAFSCVMCELLAGSKRMIVTFFLSDWSATILTSSVLALMSHFNIERATDAIHITDAGTSAAAVGALAAAAALLLPPRVACFAYGLVIIATFTLMDVEEFGPAVVHLSAIIVGGALGRFAWRPYVYPAIHRHLTLPFAKALRPFAHDG